MSNKTVLLAANKIGSGVFVTTKHCSSCVLYKIVNDKFALEFSILISTKTLYIVNRNKDQKYMNELL